MGQIKDELGNHHGCTSYLLALALFLLLAACGASPSAQTAESDGQPDALATELPSLEPVPLENGEKLQVVATTSIIADVVANVGGERIDLARLIPLGVDPHGFTPTPKDLRTLADANAIFINGLGLEESLTPVLATLDNGAPIVAVNKGVTTLALDAAQGSVEDDHGHGAEDPHTWFSVDVVQQWVRTIAEVLAELDPVGADIYAANAQTYLAELTELRSELDAIVATLPEERRILITDHDSLGYLAAAYGFDVAGTVVPSLSTLASPSASDLAALQDQIVKADIPAIFVSTTVSPDLAEQIANDTGVRVVPIYTGSLSDAQGPASTYVEFMRYNLNAIVEALKGA